MTRRPLGLAVVALAAAVGAGLLAVVSIQAYADLRNAFAEWEDSHA